MICPNCGASLKYKERSYNTCSSCKQYFAFEPKVHPLLISDVMFTKTVEKLSNNGKFYFTSSQLQFVLSRKKIRSNTNVWWLIIPAVFTSFFVAIISGSFMLGVFGIILGVGLFALWLILIVFLSKKRKLNISLPQTSSEFERDVLKAWRSHYKSLPPKLITENYQTHNFNENLRGILLCETDEAASFLVANQIDTKLNLAIISNVNSKILQTPNELPILILHDASFNGLTFLEKVKQTFNNRKVIDIGLRPQSVLKTNLMQFREPNNANTRFSSLTAEENKWLNEGFYTPLFTLKPEKLIQYVEKQISQKFKNTAADNPEKAAQAIGFMTWVGEK